MERIRPIFSRDGPSFVDFKWFCPFVPQYSVPDAECRICFQAINVHLCR